MTEYDLAYLPKSEEKSNNWENDDISERKGLPTQETAGSLKETI